MPDDLDLNGPEAIILFNLAKNAKGRARSYEEEYREYKPAKISRNREFIVVENFSRWPLPEGPFDYGTKGQDGGNGIGLFSAALYAEKEGLPLYHSCDPVVGGFRVRFSAPFYNRIPC